MLLMFFFEQSLLLIGLYVFATFLVATEIGYRLGRHINRNKDTAQIEKEEKGVGKLG